MAFSVFMGLIGWDYLQDLYLRVFVHDGSGLNRQTGMLTIGRRFQKPFSAPFYEFDATLEFRPALTAIAVSPSGCTTVTPPSRFFSAPRFNP